MLYFAGSSNFSQRGLFNNLEFTCKISDATTINQTENYLNWILTDNVSVNFGKCESFPIIESVKENHKKVSFQKAKTKPVINSTVPYLDISLARVDNQQRSNLNAFFGKGRWNTSFINVCYKYLGNFLGVRSQESSGNGFNTIF